MVGVVLDPDETQVVALGRQHLLDHRLALLGERDGEDAELDARHAPYRTARGRPARATLA